ncbi:MAG: hypothetical protein DRJ10_02215 [Bacteroidetes bacterium]|nr:MAG: hypothetical protein DRJ10_02215 [Bacteroidota bacterium]RLD85649.1 MAG: hypothetical protein DRJ07_02595 [Bacteroidota bacterium]
MEKKHGLSILIVAMSLATAWAIRGQFGHEQGAAWAGGIGALALVMVSQRKDWYNKMSLIALASAVGWGAGGMISYGMVVGYGFANNFINSFYGLTMLFVIGSLFGLLGGGLVGLTLDSVKNNKVKWGRLVSEMVAGGLIGYYFLVEQIGFYMTPPRSEAWAVILGAGLAMLWYMAREKRNSAIRVAIFSALGAGFGFGFGNFLQIAGNVMEIDFNMWNVMEYSIGFFGGSGMAYGVFSSVWPKDDTVPENWVNKISAFIVVIVFPLIVFRESLRLEHFMKRLGDIPNLENVALTSTWIVVVILLAMVVSVFMRLRKTSYDKSDVMFFFFAYLIVYTLTSYIITGLFAGNTSLNHHLYVLNIVLVFIFLKKDSQAIFSNVTDKIETKRWMMYLIGIILFLALLSLIAINIHGELGGSHDRFPVN